MSDKDVYFKHVFLIMQETLHIKTKKEGKK